MSIDEYVTRLQAFPEFESGACSSSLQFEYAAADEEHLASLRRTHDITAIPAGADVLREAVDSMSWVFGRFRHKGDAVDLPATNALEILARSDEGTFYCSHKAVVLNEVLLARGVHARVVTCFPQHFDMDRHVAVLLFVPDQGKWVFLDPTFNTYFHDGQSGALGPIEIREAYRQGGIPEFAEIPINKTWTLVLGGEEYDTYREWYAAYMAKNCFRFSSPTLSSFGTYGSSSQQMAYLNPLGYTAQNEYDDLGRRSRPNLYTHGMIDFLSPPE